MSSNRPRPEGPQPRTDDPDAPPRPRHGRRTPPDPATPDEFSVLLSPSLADADSTLGSGPSSWDLAKMAARQAERPNPAEPPRSGLDVGVDLAPAAGTDRGRATAEHAGPAVDWPGLLLRSYASAVTLGLAWLLWSGKLSPPPAPSRPAPSAREAAAPRRRVVEPSPPPIVAAAPANSPAVTTVSLGRSILADEIEVTPLLVLRRSVRLVRDLGEESILREHGDCLALTIRLRNLSEGGEREARPIVAADLIDGDAFGVDAPSGPPIAMFALAPSADWSIEGQSFPAIAPGESADVVLLSEPLEGRRLSPGMTWRLRVATDPDRTRFAKLGVAFGPNDIP
ncbi:hypothetical protein [Paludisphaera sp.]|uniref:hypothetical protein n=1 Tax=Paludisphaera sp. TaxID=2017432 RepID=UPI00301C538F